MENLKLITELSNDLIVLYIEDHKETREELLELLETVFPSVLSASNGLEGLHIYQNNPVDLIITDINMPVMDGISMIEKIRSTDQEVKIVVFSAHNKIENLSRCIELDVDGFLTKPLNYKKYFQTFYKVVKQIHTSKELSKYKSDLENKVQEQLTELLEKNAILEKNARFVTMGEMIDAIAHQWKTPLSIVKMYIELVTLNMNSDHFRKEEVLEYMEKTEVQIRHLFETIEEFRKFFRLNNEVENISVKTLIDSTLLLVKDELIRNTIITNCECDKDLEVMVNHNEFKHVLINLIQNSKEAFLQNDIENRIIEIKAEQVEDKVEIKVYDNAGGIPESILEKIFTSDFTTKGEGGGTGIGLYLVKQILEKVDGEIVVENYAQGACFTITL